MTVLIPVTCITIIAGSGLESHQLGGLADAESRGWTVTAARGHGLRGRGVSEIEGGSLCVEVLVLQSVYERIWRLLVERCVPRCTIAAWSNEVAVVRAERCTAILRSSEV